MDKVTEKNKKLQTLRKMSLNDIQIILDIARKAKTDISYKTLFKVRLEDLEAIRAEFCKHHSGIISNLLSVPDAGIDDEEKVREFFLEQFYEIKSIEFDMFNSPSGNANNDSLSSAGHNNSTILLPKLSLPSFRGDFKEFMSYLDLFNSMVHNNSNLTDVERFRYLKSSLEGPPLSLIRNLSITNENYAIAYSLLEKRYSNIRRRATAHWEALMNAPKVAVASSKSLSNLVDTFQENLAALKTLGLPTDSWDFILFNLLLSRLDADTIKLFELENKSDRIPSFNSLVTFVETQYIAYDNLNIGRGESKNSSRSSTTAANDPRHKWTEAKTRSHSSSFLVNSSSSSSLQCPLCKQNHYLNHCSSFLKKSPKERYEFCKSSSCCFRCLNETNHNTKSCPKKFACSKCQSPLHNVLLHFGKDRSNSPRSSESGASNEIEENPTNPSHCSTSLVTKKVESKQEVLLGTVVVHAIDCKGGKIPLRCLVDSASMSSFISRKAANKLGFPKKSCSLEIVGLDSMKTKLNQGSISFSIQPRHTDSPVFSLEAVITDRVCGELPSTEIDISSWNHIRNLRLGDPEFYRKQSIDLLIGCSIFAKMLLGDKLIGQEGMPDALNTVFGYILLGPTDSHVSSPSTSLVCVSNGDMSLSNSLEKFWEIENVPENKVEEPEDALCEQIYQENCRRDASGRYIVALPFRESSPNLSGSYDIAYSRFLSLERRLLNQPKLYKEYSAHMQEYIDLGHMTLVSPVEREKGLFYIPHHMVTKSDKVRVVYNASQKCPRLGKSLNDCLLVGPKLQQDLVSLLFNFRLNRYAICTDIRQMYRNILIIPEHTEFQRIFWRFSPYEEVEEYKLLTVTFGILSSPYLALRTLQQLVIDEGNKFPLAASIIRNFSYVDDFVFGAPSQEEAQLQIKELIDLLKLGGFELRKWCSNEPSLLSQFPASHINPHSLNFDTESNGPSSVKILGLQWNAQTDVFKFSVVAGDDSCSKRSLLSELARTFDPCGFLSPVTFSLKYLIQRLWATGLNWDDRPPFEIIRVWEQYKRELPLLLQFHIPRFLNVSSHPIVELHGFADGSEKGYACVVYVRSIDSGNRVSVNLLCSKSKIASITQKLTIPRIELLATVLLIKLVSFIVQSWKGDPFKKIYAYSDSQIVLHWLKSSPSRYKVFVANRISYVQSHSQGISWRYVESKNNAADAPSRGMLPATFLSHTQWLTGPEFLHSLSIKLPVVPLSLQDDLPLEEEKKISTFVATRANNFLSDLLENKSSFASIQRVLAYILRFVHNSRCHTSLRSGSLSSLELEDSLLILVKFTQENHFEEQFQSKLFPKSFRKLGVFFDNNNCLRISGRLSYSSLSYQTKHPFLLPRDSRLTRLLIRYYHEKYLHAGFKSTQFLISQRFWILSAKRAVNSVVSKCIRCWKQAPKALQPPMGNLPQFRLSAIKPFSICGLDFGGPFYITMTRHRGVRSQKAYLCLFVCCATKALHLELASNLSADAFLAALQRFIARRGRVSQILCDNGTNFVGAYNQLRNFMKEASEKEQIKFSFAPPAAPHFGGLYERGIRSVKNHLARVVGNQILTYEEFYTTLTLVESVLNSRPLTPLTSDVEDLNALTPGHFLTLEPLSSLPIPDFSDVPLNRLSRWQLLQRMHQDFWSRWHKEYLHTLQQRSKWWDPLVAPAIGSLVLLKEDNLSPCMWALGRLIQLHPGKDGVSRVATVRTARGVLKRPLVKLCPLPLDEE